MTYSEKVLDLLERGDIVAAQKEFELALKNDSDDMLFSLAEELYSLGFTQWAQKAYKLLLTRYPEEDQLKTLLADIAISEGDDEAVINYLADIKPDSDAYLQSLLVAADYYQTQGMFEVSESKLLTAYELAPDEPIIQFALAEFYFNSKEYNKAKNLYLKLLKEGVLEMSRVNIVQRLGLSYAGIGQFDKALAYLEQIPESQLDVDTRFQLAFTQLQLGMKDEAERNFEKLIELDPGYATAYPYLADIQQEKGELGQALKTYQEGLTVDEFNLALYSKASTLAASLGEVDLAEKYLKKALTLDAENLALLSQLSDLYLRQHLYEANVKLLTEALADGVADAKLYWHLGQSYAALDEYDKALPDYEAAQTDLSNDPAFLKDATHFYRNAGKMSEALKCLNEYLKLVPNDIEMLELQDVLAD